MTAVIIVLAFTAALLSLLLIASRRRYLNLKTSLEQGQITMYDKLKDSEEDKIRLKRQLTQNVAHELKTPVSSIQGYLETLVNDTTLDEETRESFIKRCYSQSRRLSALVQDISTLNKIDDAPQSYEKEPVNIASILHTIARDTDLQLKEHRIRFMPMIAPDVNVLGDHSLIYSIFRNLTDNSIAYAGDESTITAQILKENENEYQFLFADNGAGLPAEHLPHLFERFYRVDKGRSRKLGGTGLGLAIVKNSVLLHHGTITARIGKTGGLEFLFTLPKVK